MSRPGMPSPAPAGEDVSTSILAPLRVANYRLLLGTTGLLWAGRWMETVVLSWLVLQMTDSAWNVALVGFCRVLAMPLLGVLGGAFADRFDRRRLLLTLQWVNLGVTVVMAGLLATNLLTLWMIYAATVIMGIAWSIDFPARRSIVPDLVGIHLIHRSIVLDTSASFLMKIIGPILGGALFRPLGPFGCYLVLAAIYLLSIVLFLNIRVKTATGTSSTGEVWRNLRLGFRYVGGSQVILSVLGITVVMNFLGFPYMQMVPVMVRDVLGVGPEHLGLLIAADGVGTLIGAGLLARFGDWRRGWVYIAGSLGLGLFLILFALSQWYWLSFVLLLGAGICLAGFATNQTTIILLTVAPDMRGRAMGVLTAAIGTLPAGFLLIGALADALGAPLAILAMAGVCSLVVAAIALRSPQLRAQ